MPQPDEILPEIYVQPGESHLVTQPAILRTVLGSCVGLAFQIPRLGVGALCHPMLPEYPSKSSADQNVTAGRRYVDFAIRDLGARFNSMGARPNEVRVKLFGGGDVLPAIDPSTRATIGKLNCDVALRVLHELGFEALASRLGGTSGVTIKFNTSTGEVLLKRLG